MRHSTKNIHIFVDGNIFQNIAYESPPFALFKIFCYYPDAYSVEVMNSLLSSY